MPRFLILCSTRAGRGPRKIGLVCLCTISCMTAFRLPIWKVQPLHPIRLEGSLPTLWRTDVHIEWQPVETNPDLHIYLVVKDLFDRQGYHGGLERCGARTRIYRSEHYRGRTDLILISRAAVSNIAEGPSSFREESAEWPGTSNSSGAHSPWSHHLRSVRRTVSDRRSPSSPWEGRRTVENK